MDGDQLGGIHRAAQQIPVHRQRHHDLQPSGYGEPGDADEAKRDKGWPDLLSEQVMMMMTTWR
jgi:hypothetical protein